MPKNKKSSPSLGNRLSNLFIAMHGFSAESPVGIVDILLFPLYVPVILAVGLGILLPVFSIGFALQTLADCFSTTENKSNPDEKESAQVGSADSVDEQKKTIKKRPFFILAALVIAAIPIIAIFLALFAVRFLLATALTAACSFFVLGYHFLDVRGCITKQESPDTLTMTTNNGDRIQQEKPSFFHQLLSWWSTADKQHNSTVPAVSPKSTKNNSDDAEFSDTESNYCNPFTDETPDDLSENSHHSSNPKNRANNMLAKENTFLTRLTNRFSNIFGKRFIDLQSQSAEETNSSYFGFVDLLLLPALLPLLLMAIEKSAQQLAKWLAKGNKEVEENFATALLFLTFPITVPLLILRFALASALTAVVTFFAEPIEWAMASPVPEVVETESNSSTSSENQQTSSKDLNKTKENKPGEESKKGCLFFIFGNNNNGTPETEKETEKQNVTNQEKTESTPGCLSVFFGRQKTL